MAVMMTPRESWTDQRLDDLNRKVDEGFKAVDARFLSLEERIDARFDSLNRTLLGGAIGIIATMVGSTASLIGIAVL